jgi:hypothetical protein
MNQALARRAEVTCRQETYAGPWLPEPLVTERFSAAALGGDLRALVFFEFLTENDPYGWVIQGVPPSRCGRKVFLYSR